MKKALIPVIELFKVRLPHKIRLSRVSLAFSRETNKKRIKPALALENGFGFLLESGGRILIEREGSKAYPPLSKTPPILCLENGRGILMECGASLQLENNHQ